MAYVKRHRVNLSVTASGGAAHTFYSDPIVNGGWVESIVYNRATASAISTAAKIVITAACSSAPILTIATASGDSMVFYPHGPIQDTSGGAVYNATEASAGQRQFGARIPVAQERVQLVITSGGAASGTTLRAFLDLYISGA